MIYRLTKEMETGNEIIDKEHRELLAMVNKMMNACNNGKGQNSLASILDFLTDYAERHFKHEEEFQKMYDYSGYLSHRAFHQDFKKNLLSIVSDIPESGPTSRNLSSINQQINDLINHIRTEDKKLSEFLKDKNQPIL